MPPYSEIKVICPRCHFITNRRILNNSYGNCIQCFSSLILFKDFKDIIINRTDYIYPYINYNHVN
jgi:hypothetical protein